jgi:hypothetical protein
MEDLMDEKKNELLRRALIQAGKMSSAIDRFSVATYASTHPSRRAGGAVTPLTDAASAWGDLLTAKRHYDQAIEELATMGYSSEP